MSFAADVSRAIPVFRSDERDKEQPEPKRKSRSQRFDTAIRSLSRGIVSSNLHREDDLPESTSDNEASPVPRDPGLGLLPPESTSGAEALPVPLDPGLGLTPTRDDLSFTVPTPSFPVAQSIVSTLAQRKAQIIAHASQNQWDQVLTLCTGALAVYPDDLELMEFKGYAHAGKGQWNEALECSNQILRAQNDHENARNLQRTSLTKRAEAYFSEQKWEQASEDYEVLVRLHPDAEIFRKLAASLGYLQRWERALHCFKYLVDSYGEQDIQVWRQIGFCCLKRRQGQVPFLAGEAEFTLEACKKLIAVPEYSRDPQVWQLGFLAVTQMLQASASQPPAQSQQ